MKRRDIEKRLRQLGGQLDRRGGNHDIWLINGQIIAVPRHIEINEHTARGILRQATTAAAM